MVIDKIDRRILRVLQGNARTTYSQLAEGVGLTTSPCIERVKRLEQAGYIEGYFSKLSASKLDVGLVVFVEIRLDRTSKSNFVEFRRRIKQLEQVQECYLVTGNFDFLLKIRLKDMEAYRQFLENELLSIPAVQSSTSITVMDSIKETMALPIE